MNARVKETPLDPVTVEVVRAALPAMEKMSDTLHRMQRDCRDPA